MGSNSCPTCGRCSNCGALEGAGKTLVFNSPNVNGAAAAPNPVFIETNVAAGGTQTIGGCEHFVLRG